MVLLIIIPMKNGYFIGNINPTFSDKAILFVAVDDSTQLDEISLLRRKSEKFYLVDESLLWVLRPKIENFAGDPKQI